VSHKLFDLTGRTVVVVGGTSGIGRTLAVGFAEAGANTIATGRRQELVSSVQAEIEALGVRSFGATCDVSSAESVKDFSSKVIDFFGGVDVVVYAAGVTKRAPTATFDLEVWNQNFDTNVAGALRVSQAFYEPLKQSNAARIINICSLSSFRAFHEVAAYGASKSALLSLTRNLGCEWAKDGIRTNAIVPGVFVTDLNRELLNGTERGKELLTRTPLGRFGDVSELVGTALFLASDASAFITGSHIVVDGGFLASGVNQ
jgi:NAD(P)-dependent dehydrogenase (short-subunit alcohol dehydrogenase family)